MRDPNKWEMVFRVIIDFKQGQEFSLKFAMTNTGAGAIKIFVVPVPGCVPQKYLKKLHSRLRLRLRLPSPAPNSTPVK